MSDFDHTSTEKALIETARAFARDQVAPRAATWERERRFPKDAIKEAAKLGLTGIEAPKDMGGRGARFSAKLRIAEEIARQDFGVAFSLINTQNIAARIAQGGTAKHKAKYLPGLLAGELIGGTALSEPDAGSDFPAITTTARKVAGGYEISGEKGWITNVAAGDVFIVYAKTEGAPGNDSIAAFLVDAGAKGFERLPPYDLMGASAIGTGGFRLDNVRVADEDMLYPPGQAFKRALVSINGARAYVAAMCCGMIAEALRLAVARGGERKTFGKPLLDHQGLRWSLVDVANTLEAMRLLTYRAAKLIDDGQDAMLAAAHAKKFAAENAQPALAACQQAMGAEGLKDRYPIGRHMAGARIAAYVDGSTEMQNERIGAALTKGAF
jgi:alkylation response protein AidB-like acyl-CoA dehydrogenase